MALGSAAGFRLRDWAARTVQWDPARNTAKRVVYAIAHARGSWLERTGNLPPVCNIFAAMTPRSGSQWAKAVFDHELVRSRTGLLTLPQLAFEFGLHTPPFPAATFVPGLYTSYDSYQQLPKPYTHRTVYIFRDPRDIVVSAYFAGIETHRRVPHLEATRRALRTMSLDRGLLYTIEIVGDKLREMASWVDVEDDSVARFRLEDVSADPVPVVRRMLEHCGVHLAESELAQVVFDTSRDSLQQRDLAGRDAGAESHYRRNPQRYRELFKREHYRTVEETVPGLIETLGYPTSPNG